MQYAFILLLEWHDSSQWTEEDVKWESIAGQNFALIT